MDENTLVTNNVGLVYKQLHRFNLAYDDDAISYAFEGLLKAVRTYNADVHVAFSTYASVCIYNAIQMLLRKRNAKRQLQVVSYDEESPVTKLSLADTLCTTTSPEQDLLATLHYNSVLVIIDKIIDGTETLSHKDVLCTWAESDFTLKQKELAKMFGFSQSYVSRIISCFKNTLKKELEELL